MTEYQKLQELILSKPSRIVILSHRNPDGDAIGSSIGLCLFLQKFMHTVHIIFPSEYPLSFSYLKNSEDIVIYDIEAEHAQNLVAQAEIIFCLDFNDLDRIDKLGVSVAENIKAKKDITENSKNTSVRVAILPDEEEFLKKRHKASKSVFEGSKFLDTSPAFKGNSMPIDFFRPLERITPLQKKGKSSSKLPNVKLKETPKLHKV